MDVNNCDCLEYMDWNCFYTSRSDTAALMPPPPSTDDLQSDDRVEYDENY